MTSSGTGSNVVHNEQRLKFDIADKGTSYRILSSQVRGEDLIRKIKKKSYRINELAIEILESPHFLPTTRTYVLLLVKGKFFSDAERVARVIYPNALEQGLLPLTAEAAALFRLEFSNADLGGLDLEDVVAPNYPHNNTPSDDSPLQDCFLRATWGISSEGGKEGIGATYCAEDHFWHKDTGFLFLKKT